MFEARHSSFCKVYNPSPELQSFPSGYPRLGPSLQGVRQSPNVKRLHGSRLNLASSNRALASASKCPFRHGARLALPFCGRSVTVNSSLSAQDEPGHQ